jgi:predicted N-acyltransferase
MRRLGRCRRWSGHEICCNPIRIDITQHVNILQLVQTSNILEIDAAKWNRLAGGSPFLRHEFLVALERTGCVGADTAWQPNHLCVMNDDQALIGAMPLYIKNDSRGEFVFDWGWAHA